MAISMLKIRRPLGRLIFNMGIAIPGKTVFLIETAPWSIFHCICSISFTMCYHSCVYISAPAWNTFSQHSWLFVLHVPYYWVAANIPQTRSRWKQTPLKSSLLICQTNHSTSVKNRLLLCLRYASVTEVLPQIIVIEPVLFQSLEI